MAYQCFYETPRGIPKADADRDGRGGSDARRGARNGAGRGKRGGPFPPESPYFM
ncbi:MAG: hypothetical protein IJK52_07985 [Oscillospiraceae bacterium]|nr:hypothetical protein [Oscillospiraceae bacterium]